ncbi:MAG: hypothetical protein ACKJSG_18570, partial [Lentisphaeria bacterium]
RCYCLLIESKDQGAGKYPFPRYRVFVIRILLLATGAAVRYIDFGFRTRTRSPARKVKAVG